jgi:hypothetical protein
MTRSPVILSPGGGNELEEGFVDIDQSPFVSAIWQAAAPHQNAHLGSF